MLLLTIYHMAATFAIQVLTVLDDLWNNWAKTMRFVLCSGCHSPYLHAPLAFAGHAATLTLHQHRSPLSA